MKKLLVLFAVVTGVFVTLRRLAGTRAEADLWHEVTRSPDAA
jgi:hypothetical protein